MSVDAARARVWTGVAPPPRKACADTAPPPVTLPALLENPIHPRSDLRRAELVALVVILGYGIVVRAIYLDRPFHRDAEGVACFYGQLARNYIRRPFSETKAVPVQSLALDTPPTFYSHHPPLIPLEIAAVYWTIGF